MKALGPLQGVGKQIARSAKNYTAGYSDVQILTRAATSSDPWGPSGTQMNEISQHTFTQSSFIEIMVSAMRLVAC